MSGLLDELDDHQDHEITLGTGALLAIFFGVVLVCAVFFGLGYSMGRRSGESPAGAAKTGSPNAAAGSTAAANVSVPEVSQAEKPSASASPARAPRVPPKPAPPPGLDNSAENSSAAKGSPGAKGAIMVQLMAAAQLEDAQVLATALNKRGYSAVVRSEPDRLFHVQVGPFATRAEADAMRRRLQGDGYNAILK